MNAFHVIVSIHILIVLARFNNAHGLSTFGIKSGSQAPVEGTRCKNQSECVIKGTTCIGQFCLCGDNTHPSNGVCRATLKSPKHLCEDDNECVAGADCIETKDVKLPSGAAKTCQCQEGLTETHGTCSGVRNLVLPSLLLISALLAKMY